MPPASRPDRGGPNAAGRARFPLSVSSTGRYLVDADAAPSLLIGDAAWSLVVTSTRDEALRYLDDRAARGFNAASRIQIQRRAYWSVLCDGFGHCLGVYPLSWFGPGWEDALDSPGARAMTILGRLLGGSPWWDLIPDQEYRLIVEEVGEYRGLDCCAAAVTRNGRFGAAYLPSPRAITVDLARLADGLAAFTWVNPSTAERGPTTTRRTRGRSTFLPPWEHDALLVMDVQAARS